MNLGVKILNLIDDTIQKRIELDVMVKFVLRFIEDHYSKESDVIELFPKVPARLLAAFIQLIINPQEHQCKYQNCALGYVKEMRERVQREVE